MPLTYTCLSPIVKESILAKQSKISIDFSQKQLPFSKENTYIKGYLDHVLRYSFNNYSDQKLSINIKNVYTVDSLQSQGSFVSSYLEAEIDNELVFSGHLNFNVSIIESQINGMMVVNNRMVKLENTTGHMCIEKADNGFNLIATSRGCTTVKRIKLSGFDFTIILEDSYTQLLNKSFPFKLESESHSLESANLFFVTNMIKYNVAEFNSQEYFKILSSPLEKREKSLLASFADKRSLSALALSISNEEKILCIKKILDIYIDEFGSDKICLDSESSLNLFSTLRILSDNITFSDDTSTKIEYVMDNFKSSSTYLKFTIVDSDNVNAFFSKVSAEYFSGDDFNNQNFMRFIKHICDKDMSLSVFEQISFIENFQSNNNKNLEYGDHSFRPTWLELIKNLSTFLLNNSIEEQYLKKISLSILFELFTKVENDILSMIDSPTRMYYSTHHNGEILEAGINVEKFLSALSAKFQQPIYGEYVFLKYLLKYNSNEKNYPIFLAGKRNALFKLILKRFNRSINDIEGEEIKNSYVKSLNALFNSYFPDMMCVDFAKQDKLHDDVIELLYRLSRLTTSPDKRLVSSTKSILTTVYQKISNATAHFSDPSKPQYFNPHVCIDGKYFDTFCVYIFSQNTIQELERNKFFDEYVTQLRGILSSSIIQSAVDSRYIGPLFYEQRSMFKIGVFTLLLSLCCLLSILYVLEILSVLFKFQFAFLNIFSFCTTGVPGIILPAVYIIASFFTFQLGKSIFGVKIDSTINFDWSNCKVVTSSELLDSSMSSDSRNSTGLDYHQYEDGYMVGKVSPRV